MMLLFVGSTAAERLNETSAYLTCITTPASCTRMSMRNISLAGSLPSELGTLTRLTSIFIPFNQLTGTLPTELGALTRLTFLDIGANQLIGTLPSELVALQSLTALAYTSWCQAEVLLHSQLLSMIVVAECVQLVPAAHSFNHDGRANL